jgi:starvation-inducible DNA-binding protein
MVNTHTGIGKTERDAMAQQLSVLLASNYLLYIKTQNFHWNVKGPFFQTLHLMFEAQYNELALANDLIAERIRALGILAPGNYAKFAELSFVTDSPEDLRANEMVQTLLADHETMIQRIRTTLAYAADIGDDATGDLLAPRINAHEKTAWMLRTFLEE